jgi:hypothetical protein
VTLLSLKRQVAAPDDNRVKYDVGNKFELGMDERTKDAFRN